MKLDSFSNEIGGGGRSSLSFASIFTAFDIFYIKYLVSKRANKNAKRKCDGKTPYKLAKNDEIRNILK